MSWWNGYTSGVHPCELLIETIYALKYCALEILMPFSNEILTPDGLTIQMVLVGSVERPCAIAKGDQRLWSFKKDAPAGTSAELILYGDDPGEHVIALTARKVVHHVVRVADFAHMATIRVGGMTMSLGGSTIEEILDIKVAIADQLGMEYYFSREEGEILRERDERARAAHAEAVAKERAAASAEDQARKEEEARKRHEAIQALLNRKTVEGWASDGRNLYGIPVEDDEWKSLPNGRHCIQMENGQPTKAFIVVKKNGRVNQTPPIEIFPHPPTATGGVVHQAVEAEEMIRVTLCGETRAAPLLRGMEDAKALRRQGLNGGTWVVIPKKDGNYQVLAIHQNGIDTVGEVRRKNAA